ncbi:putative microbial serine proteinase [Rosellinia necatrix]|uniref:Putative microbial serine proteinase n=1 Tax=Rosellinia necatrix TaxID=77044 RepID=A0A1W2TIA9_ROSNE|nr:putative microbial serine proteinase [Rosellinia necatrix]
MVPAFPDTKGQSAPLSEAQSTNSGLPTIAGANEQIGALEEDGYETGKGYAEGEEEVDDEEEGEDSDEYEYEYEYDVYGTTEEELKGKLRDIETKLCDEGFVSKLEETEEEQQLFLGNYDIYLKMQPPAKVDNVLHFMAGKRFPSPFLIRHILGNYKDRMNDLDDAGRRPLILAIESKKEVFIKAVLESKYDDADLENILQLMSSDTGNSIHKAIRVGLDPNLTISLINKVSDEVLGKIDGEWCTPLHRAVEYKACTEAQIGVVKALLERGDSALDKKSKAGLSVYQYHFSTRPEEDKIIISTTAHNEVQPDEEINDSEPQNLPQVVGNRTEEENGRKTVDEKGGEEIADRHSPVQLQNMGLYPQLRRTATFQQEDATKDGMPMVPISPTNYSANVSRKTTSRPQPATTGPPLRAPNRSPSTTLRVSRNNKGKKLSKLTAGKIVKDTPQVSVIFADIIANEVKLQYLRSTFKNDQRNHDTAVEFLYANKQTKHICFNLLRNYKPMSDTSLWKVGYSRFEFDTVLQFVAVGPIIVQKQGKRPVSEPPRQDMETLFNLLKVKKVENIIKVVVDDHRDPFHSDEAIIKALRPFNIEILDWSKPDLCPETIRDACEGVRELHLSWSGLNGMLLAWGGTDGLATLPNLTDVYLQQVSNPEPDAWTARNLDKFEKRLQNARTLVNAQWKAETSKSRNKDTLIDLPKINVHRPRAKPKVNSQLILDGTSQGRNKEAPMKDHQWLEYMDRFSSGIFTLSPDVYISSVPNLPDELRRDVRICLIDDGVDMLHKGIAERIGGDGRAFGAYTRDEYRGMARPFYDSTTNHGTLMANMIIRVCPFAKIASYRLDTRQGGDKRVHFTTKSAADALEHAVGQDFDIISMSWTVREETGPDEDNTKDIARIKAALRQATTNNKLVFCSAPDTGDMSLDELSSYFPVGSGVPGLFRIGAAKADNTPWPQAGGRDIVDYVLPGHDVREKEGHEVIQNDTSLKSGSSIATALAAGFAALMIHVVRMAAIRTYELGNQTSKEANIIKLNSLKTIKSPATMRKTFDSMTANKTYVHVWGDFYRKGLELKAADDRDDPEAEKWRIIGELARDIVSSKNTYK